MDIASAQAMIRFGLGRRGTEPLPSDPRAWLHAQLATPPTVVLDPLPGTAECLAKLRADQLYWPRLVRHHEGSYAASAAGESRA